MSCIPLLIEVIGRMNAILCLTSGEGKRRVNISINRQVPSLFCAVFLYRGSDLVDSRGCSRVAVHIYLPDPVVKR
jgi:hypothetical protein